MSGKSEGKKNTPPPKAVSDGGKKTDQEVDLAEEEKIRLEKEAVDLEAEKEKIERQKEEEEEIVRKAQEINKLINPDSSDEEVDDLDGSQIPSQIVEKKEVQKEGEEKEPLVPFWDFALDHLLVGLVSLELQGAMVHCGSCQKELEMDSLKAHIEGDGHKLNTLWNYDRSLAEMTGELRTYPEKFEIEMFKHIAMLNRMERRHEVSPSVENAIRELYRDVTEVEPSSQVKNERPEIPPEEMAEIKADFMGAFPNEEEAILVQQALMGDLNGFNSPFSAVTALKIATNLGKMICTYQRKNLEKGYKVDETVIREIKDHCTNLLKLVDETRLMNR